MKRSTKTAALILLTVLPLPSVVPAATAEARTDSRTGAEAGPETTALEYLDRLPPLLDRQLFFDDPEISASQISPDGEHMTFLKPYEGVKNIWIKELGESFEAARPLTDDDRPVPGYFWSEDGKLVLYVQDKDGNENFHVYAVDPSAAAEKETGVPPARDLTPIEDIRAFIYAVPEGTPGKILIGLNDRDPALHDVYRLDLATGERELLIENDSNVASWIPDLEGEVRLAVRQTSDGSTEILKVEDGKLGEVVYTCSWRETCQPNHFHEDGKRVYLVSNKGEEVDLTGLYLMDATTGETTLVERDPQGEVDFGGTIFSDATEELIGTVYVGDRTRIYPKTEELESALDFLEEELPDGEISFSPQTNDDRLVKVVVSRDVDPGTVYLYDWKENTVQKLYETRPELPTEHLASMEAIRYQARDGLTIPAYLTTPEGVEAKNLALIVLPHGGPWSRDTWGYSSIDQFLANRGYAVLSPNFRGSTGYGKEFLNAGNREWGEAMQDDVSDGVRYLVEKGIVDPDRVCIMGGSYGGYATLAGVTFTPELYACGVDIVGPSNLITLLNSIPPYWGPIRKIFLQRMGDPGTEEGKEQLKDQSPLFSVEKIEDPLLVIQGANDPRVKKAEADQIVVAMREKRLPVEYIVAPDEGHGFRGRENRLAMYARIEDFLAEHLGGRHQESMAPAVAETLEKITVNVATVEEPKRATELDVAKVAPLPTVSPGEVQKGSMAYTSTLSARSREMTIDSTRRLETVEEEGETYLKVASASEGPMGEGQDVFLLDPETLRPVRRSASQGTATIETEYGSKEVTGEIVAGPQKIPVEIALEAPVFGGEAAFDAVVTALPLTEEYRTTVRTAEVGMQQRVRYFSVTVTGRETVEVPAGSFETWRVEIEPLDGEGGGQTAWITTESPRVIVQSEGELPPQMGDGTVTTVLTERPE